jgi:hypothetical protein
MPADDNDEASLPVADLLRWMSRGEPEALRALLIGCDLDDGRNDDLLPIADVDVPGCVLVVAGRRRVPLRTVMGGAIVDRRPGWPLCAAYAAARTPAEEREAAERAGLRRFHIDPDRLASSQDRRVVLTFLRAVTAQTAISGLALDAFHEAMKRSSDIAVYRRAADALRWLGRTSSHPPVTLPWRLAWFLNRAGQHEEAVTVSEAPEAGRLQGMDLVYMAGIRASALISLGTMRRDPTLLDKAEQAIRIAAAHGSDCDAINTLYATLRAARVQAGVC